MKATLFDKFLLLLVLLLLLAFAGVLACFALGLFLFPAAAVLLEMVEQQLGALNFQIILGAAALLVVLIALRLFVGFYGKRRDAKPRTAPVTAATIATTDFGVTEISLAAIDAMVQRHCRANNKIRETESVIAGKEGGIHIGLKLVLLNDANVPDTTAELQKSLKEYIESLTGILVHDISILIVSQPPAHK
ncbi:MAG: alkaline shock response membrane anchor protein AmaP [Christensenellaceae bacterium]|jgi:uncharacterized alkaline shock family protein YloU|nr:alkaline shock response membrane anchor protein AmaP [Christensenellaceae bacterium]